MSPVDQVIQEWRDIFLGSAKVRVPDHVACGEFETALQTSIFANSERRGSA